MASRVDNQAVVSSAFRPFPRLTNGKIKTYDFLEASRGIVEILGDFILITVFFFFFVGSLIGFIKIKFFCFKANVIIRVFFVF